QSVLSLSVFQSFSLSVFQSFSPSVFQSLSLSVPQSFSPSVFQSFSLSVPQSFSPSVFQSFSLHGRPDQLASSISRQNKSGRYRRSVVRNPLLTILRGWDGRVSRDKRAEYWERGS